MDALAVGLIVPLVGPIVDFHPQVIRPPPRVSEQHQSVALRAMPPGAHKKTPPTGGVFKVVIWPCSVRPFAPTEAEAKQADSQ